MGLLYLDVRCGLVPSVVLVSLIWGRAVLFMRLWIVVLFAHLWLGVIVLFVHLRLRIIMLFVKLRLWVRVIVLLMHQGLRLVAAV